MRGSATGSAPAAASLRVVCVARLAGALRYPHPGLGCPRRGMHRDYVSTIGPMAPGLVKISSRRRPHPVAYRHADMLHDQIVAVTIDHARGAAIAHALGPVEFLYVAERSVPMMTSPKLQVPIQIERFPSRQACETLSLAAQVALHVLDRRDRVLHRKLSAQRFDRLEAGRQFFGRKVDERQSRPRRDRKRGACARGRKTSARGSRGLAAKPAGPGSRRGGSS